MEGSFTQGTGWGLLRWQPLIEWFESTSCVKDLFNLLEIEMRYEDMKGFVALSGGLDSTTALAIAMERHEGKVEAISFDYGQRHNIELERAALIAEYYDICHHIVKLGDLPTSALTDTSIDIPKVSYAEIEGISPTYVPFRNGQIIAKLTAYASADKLNSVVYVGTHAEDAANDAYPDCRLDFIGAMGSAVYIGTYHKVRLSAPLIEMSKSEVVALAAKLEAPLELSWSCYFGGDKHCGVCPTCRARKEAFLLAGVPDPTSYKE
jgi:7-cyano-7-deazaguanine synthase